jgi:hypothetical protein
MDAYLSSFSKARQASNVEKFIESLLGYLASIGANDRPAALKRALSATSSRVALERHLNSAQLAGASHAS